MTQGLLQALPADDTGLTTALTTSLQELQNQTQRSLTDQSGPTPTPTPIFIFGHDPDADTDADAVTDPHAR